LLAKVMNYGTVQIKYNTVVCCYVKVLVNVAAHVIPGYVCIVCVCVCVCVCVFVV